MINLAFVSINPDCGLVKTCLMLAIAILEQRFQRCYNVATADFEHTICQLDCVSMRIRILDVLSMSLYSDIPTVSVNECK